MENHTHKGMATKLLVAGILLILVRTLTEWDMWVVVGAILIIKALVMYSMSGCCQKKAPRKR